MIWALLQHVGGQALTFVIYLTLAALLSPADFGLLGLATVWTAFLGAFAELGLGAALIQRRSLDPAHASSTFVTNLALGGVLSLAGLVVSWPAAVFVHEPRLQPVLASLSVGFLLRAFGLTHAALAQRELRFRPLAVRDLIANGVGGLSGIAIAASGGGVWSLVAVNLVAAGVGSALLWQLSSWRPSFALVSKSAIRDLWGFGANVLAFNVFKAAAQNLDRLIIGRLFGTIAVGYYSLASRIMLQPVATIIGAMGVYFFPTVARAQHDPPAVAMQYRTIIKLSVAATVPIAVAGGILAPRLVPALLGSRWNAAGPLFLWLGVAAVCRGFFSPAGQLMKGLGHPGSMLGWSIIITGLTLAGLLGGGHWGLTGSTIGFATAHVVGTPIVVGMCHRLLGFSGRDHMRAVAPALGLGVILAAALTGIAKLASTPVAVAAAGVVGIIGYVGAILKLEPQSREFLSWRMVEPIPNERTAAGRTSERLGLTNQSS
ncbi:MAG TPA: lipopolysaccharide biosynthesis protein [Gemmatimonadaceae bacterium]|nr:lipopolysaccharide biosynthesis protein [Gemmatimonadaceae bacterium]